MAYSFYRTVTIDRTKCGAGTFTNFPMAFVGTYAGGAGALDLRDNESGGAVQNDSGWDIAFYSDSALTTLLDFERVVRVGASGVTELWVEIPTLNGSDQGSNTVIYLAYGDAGIGADPQNGTGTWNSTFKIVSHYADGTTLSVVDSTVNANHGTNNGTVAAAAGQIDGGALENGTANRFVSYPAVAAMEGAANMTISCWGNRHSSTGNLFVYMSPGVFSKVFLQSSFADPNDFISGVIGATELDGTTTSNLMGVDAWHHLVVVFDGSLTGNARLAFYIDGAAQTLSYSGTGPATVDSAGTGYRVSSANSSWPDWTFDEFHMIAGSLTAAWVTTEYNNQNSPSTFYTIGAETSVGGAAATGRQPGRIPLLGVQ